MADDPKSISKALNEMVDLMKKANAISEGAANTASKNTLNETETNNENRRERARLLQAIKGISDGFTKNFKSFIDGMQKPTAKGLFKGIAGIFSALLAGPAIAALLGFFGPEGRLALFAAKILSLSDDVMKVVGKIKPFLGPGGKIAGFATKFLLPLQLLIDGIIGAIKGFTESEESNFGLKLVDALQGAFAQIISGLSFGLLSFDAVSAFVDPFFENMKLFFGNVFAIINDPELSVFQKIGLIFSEYWDYAMESLRIQFQMVYDLVGMMFSVIRDNFSIEGLMNLGSTVVDGIVDGFMWLSNWLFENFKRPITYLAMTLDNIMSHISEQFSATLGAVIDSINIFGIEKLDRAAADFRREANQEALNRAAKQKAYDALLAQQAEEEFQEAVDAQQARIERLRRYGDQKLLDKELNNFERRFGGSRAAADRARGILEGRNPELFTAINANQELQTATAAPGGSSTNVVAPVTNIRNTTVAAPEIRPRMAVGGEVPASGLTFQP